MYGRLKRAGHRLNPPDGETHRHARAVMKETAKVLVDDEPAIVAEAMGRYIAPDLSRVGVGSRGRTPGKPGAIYGVRAYACAIERTHVHLLTGPLREDVGRFAGRLKGSSSAALLRHPNNWGRSRIWTAGYWCVFLCDDDAVDAASHYIEEHNVRRGLPGSPFEWITSRCGGRCGSVLHCGAGGRRRR